MGSVAKVTRGLVVCEDVNGRCVVKITSSSLFAKVLNAASYHARSTEAGSKSMSLAWPRMLD